MPICLSRIILAVVFLFFQALAIEPILPPFDSLRRETVAYNHVAPALGRVRGPDQRDDQDNDVSQKDPIARKVGTESATDLFADQKCTPKLAFLTILAG